MKRKNLSSAEIQDILKRYPDDKTESIARDFNVSISHIYKTAQRYGVVKSEKFKNSPASGRIQPRQRLSPDTQFKKGYSGATKGMRIEAIIKNKEKRQNWRDKCLWKKGNKPYNTAKDGEIRFRPSSGYWHIRIAENNWEFLHRHLWTKHHGPIPEGYNILFKDGNKNNCIIENLECISNAELGERNRHTQYPYDLQKTIEEKNKLNKLLKKMNHEQ